MDIKTVNHWGIWVSSDKPITGVINSNNVAWEWLSEDICLTCEEIYRNIDNDDSLDSEEKEFERDIVSCESDHTRLLGDWILDTKTNQYDIDHNGEFAAIENESTVQVVFSKFTKKNCALCSPCYPGQVDLDSQGDFIGYTLPDYLISVENYNREFETGIKANE